MGKRRGSALRSRDANNTSCRHHEHPCRARAVCFSSWRRLVSLLADVASGMPTVEIVGHVGNQALPRKQDTMVVTLKSALLDAWYDWHFGSLTICFLNRKTSRRLHFVVSKETVVLQLVVDLLYNNDQWWDNIILLQCARRNDRYHCQWSLF